MTTHKNKRNRSVTDKRAFIAQITQQSDAIGANTYKEQVTSKIEHIIKDTYPWLSDFSLMLVDFDRDAEFAYGVGKLSGHSGGFAVEFPVFYLDGKLLDIPSFVLPERKVSFPFNKQFFNLISNTINDATGIAIVMERGDVSTAARETLNNTEAEPAAGLLKMSSFSRVLSTIPRTILRKHAKTACAYFPELTRDFYAAIKLSKIKANTKLATANLLDFSKKLDKKKEQSVADVNKADRQMLSTSTPVFRSLAEAGEQESLVDEIVQVTNKAYVLPEANNKVNLTAIPDFREVTKSLNEDFELVTPIELESLLQNQIQANPCEPVLVNCLSTNRDYWIVPPVKYVSGKGDSGGSPGDGCCNGALRDYPGEPSVKSDREFAINELGGRFLYDTLFSDGTTRSRKDFDKSYGNRVVYIPKAMESKMYFADVLNTRLNERHDIVDLMSRGNNESKVIFRSGTSGRIFNLPFGGTWECRERLPDADKTVVVKKGKRITTYKVRDRFSTEELTPSAEKTDASQPGNVDKKSLVPILRVVSDPVTGDIEKIYVRQDYINWSEKDKLDISCGEDARKFAVYSFENVYTYDPDRYFMSEDNGAHVLTPVEGNSEDRTIISGEASPVRISRTRKTTLDFSNMVTRIFKKEDLDPEFILNELGEDDGGQLQLNIPHTEVVNVADGSFKVFLAKPTEGSGVKATTFSFADLDAVLTAFAGLGVDVDDLESLKNDFSNTVKLSSSHSADSIVTKLAYAVSPTMNAEQEGLDGEMILEQMHSVMTAIQQEQEQMRDHMEQREKMIEMQMELVDQKLSGIDELNEKIDQMLGTAVSQQQEVPEEEYAPVTEEEQGIPPEVLEEMAYTVVFPERAEEMGLGPEELELLTLAADGDGQAAMEIGFSEEDHGLFMQFVEELSQQQGMDEYAEYEQNMEGGLGMQQPGEEDQAMMEQILEMGQIVADPEKAVEEGIPEETVGLLMAAMEGDPAAMEEAGLDETTVQLIAGAAEKAAQADEEEVMELARIIRNPEAALSMGVDEELISMLSAAMHGDAGAMEELGFTEPVLVQIHRAIQMLDETEGTEEDPQSEEVNKSTQEKLEESYEQAKILVQAYLNPETSAETGVTPDDLGYVAMILRSPKYAEKQGVPMNLIQAINDAYIGMTGRKVYSDAEQEFSSLPVSAHSPETGLTKNVISKSKAFDEFSKPLAETSVLLDMLPNIKTAKLFFRNANDFKNMLQILGEILINIQINAVQYRDLMGSSSYEKVLARIKKVYEDFGDLIVQMYTLDKKHD